MYAAVRTANLMLYVAYILKSIIVLAFGSLLLGFAIWLVWPDGTSWFWDTLGLLIGSQGIAIMMSGLEQFVAANTTRQKQKSPQLTQPMRFAGRENNLMSNRRNRN